ncbi:hypothetical protein LY76DRAFT_411210 [Colletotrichum caudatum]|nr:hypothetical protein LY76DRAFT_411210 [Colletotrichum caudatum]
MVTQPRHRRFFLSFFLFFLFCQEGGGGFPLRHGYQQQHCGKDHVHTAQRTEGEGDQASRFPKRRAGNKQTRKDVRTVFDILDGVSGGVADKRDSLPAIAATISPYARPKPCHHTHTHTERDDLSLMTLQFIVCTLGGESLQHFQQARLCFCFFASFFLPPFPRVTLLCFSHFS